MPRARAQRPQPCHLPENIRKILWNFGARRRAGSAQMDGAGLFHAQGQQALVGDAPAAIVIGLDAAQGLERLGDVGGIACAAPGCALSAIVRSQWPNSPFWKRCNAMPYSLIQTRCRRVQR